MAGRYFSSIDRPFVSWIIGTARYVRGEYIFTHFEKFIDWACNLDRGTLAISAAITLRNSNRFRLGLPANSDQMVVHLFRNELADKLVGIVDVL